MTSVVANKKIANPQVRFKYRNLAHWVYHPDIRTSGKMKFWTWGDTMSLDNLQATYDIVYRIHLKCSDASSNARNWLP